jgi:DnaJ-domain-containing protein 1
LLEYKGLVVAVEQPNFVEGRKASEQAKALMIMHTEDAYVKLIVGESTAAKAWEKLKQKSEKKSNARVVQLTGKLTNMKLGEKQTIAEYLGEFRKIKEDLKAAGQTVSDLQLAVHALRGLPKGYETLREILEAGDFELSLDTIQPKLMQRERTLRLQSENRGVLVDEAQTAAFAARARSNKGSEESFDSPGEGRWGSSGFRSSGFERRTCYACGEVGHIKANCRF